MKKKKKTSGKTIVLNSFASQKFNDYFIHDKILQIFKDGPSFQYQ